MHFVFKYLKCAIIHTFFFYALMCIPLFGLEAAVINIFVLIMVRIL